MLLQINNIEELFFEDKLLLKKFPSLTDVYNQWLMGKRATALRFLSQKSCLEVLEKLNTEDNLAILSKYFNEKVDIKPIEYHTVRNYKIPLSELSESINAINSFKDNFSISTDGSYCYLVFWR